MNIRAKIFHGVEPGAERVLVAKRPKGAKADDLLSVLTARSARRTNNHRTDDRHRLVNERATLSLEGQDHEVELINLSDGGAMIRSDLRPNLWARARLHLGPNGTIDCAVCWRRGDRTGLQFAQETRLDCTADQIAAVLREVITRSFPEAEFEPAEAPEPVSAAASDFDEVRDSPRHPLIWSGELHHDYQSSPVRVRNISESGAMIECTSPVRVGTEPLLELSDAVSISATVEWAVGDQVGLRFHSPFDLRLLANARPAVASGGWARPTYLNSNQASSRREKALKEAELAALRAELEGFMKR